MPEQQQQSGQDSSLDFLWIMAILLGAIILTWYFGKVYITKGVFYVRYYEIVAINFVLDFWSKLIQFIGFAPFRSGLYEWSIYIRNNFGMAVSFNSLVDLSTAVGNYLRYPLTLLALGGAAILHFTGISHRFRNTYTTDQLKKLEQVNWPQITPVANLDLVKQKLDEGPWAIALSPMRFCKKNNLLDVEEKNGKYIATLRRGSAYRVLSLQLGPRWRGAEFLPPYLKALFAIFAARINEDKKSAEVILDRISASATTIDNLNFFGVDELMRKHMNSKKVAKVMALHGYVATVLASMLVGAREVGVLATSEFLWLKPIDRRIWYMLNSVGRQTAVPEICGAFSHWLAEKKLGLPLVVPMVEEGIRGLEVSLSELIYKPEEE